MATANFKVIIVGGGPVGLVAANALLLAGIDFIVLESRDSVVVDEGASIVLGPSSLRVMHQLGLLDKLLLIGAELKHRKSLTLDGYEFDNTAPFVYMKENHGIAPHAFNRTELVKCLYESIPENSREKVITSKKVMDIISNEDGVKVTCADGTTYNGSIVLGADGVHSKTRRLMRKLAMECNPNREWDPEYPYTATYRCMWCSFPRTSVPGDTVETQHQDRSVMYLTGRDLAWIFAYEKLPNATNKPARYTERDIKQFADDFADFPVNDTLKVKDVFRKSITTGISNLEEGVVQNWSWGRIVLAGDACHKFTPNAGFGFQNGIQDVAALCNRLREATAGAPNGIPAMATLSAVFKSYQTYRSKALEGDATLSAFTTRIHAWANKLYFITARYIISLRLWHYVMVKHVAAWNIKKSLVLDYVAAEEPCVGEVNWENKMNSSSDVC